jgi:hypothetical protein
MQPPERPDDAPRKNGKPPLRAGTFGTSSPPRPDLADFAQLSAADVEDKAAY